MNRHMFMWEVRDLDNVNPLFLALTLKTHISMIRSTLLMKLSLRTLETLIKTISFEDSEGQLFTIKN